MASEIPSGVKTHSDPPPPPGAVPVYNVPPPGSEKAKRIDYIRVYGHSNLFYWWPVWVVCFALAAWTYLDGQQMAVIPPDSRHVRDARIDGFAEPREALVAPPGKGFPLAAVQTTDAAGNKVDDGHKGQVAPASMTVSGSNSLGVIFALVLFLTAIVSTIVLRGLVSVIAVVVLVGVVLALALFNLWDAVFRFVGGLDIRMNAAGYLTIGVPLFLAWVAAFFMYDPQAYVLFDEGQIRYVREVGDSEVVIPSEGSLVEKKRSDVFRHWLFGLGSGDLLIRTGGANGQVIELDNVLGINRKLDVINHMLRQKAIVAGD
jgi:hypothetical protein